jgi:putative transposase
MPRQPRIHLDGYPLHIVQRGNNRMPCFFADHDYALYLGWLGEALAVSECQLHAYALMPNHVHLLLTPNRAMSVPRVLISLGRRYVRSVNRRYARTGSLWEGRYRSSLIESDAYLLACYRYIELNPVRAGIVNDPAQYRWSSYSAIALGHVDARLTPHPLFVALGRDDPARREAYRRMFESELDRSALDEIRRSLNQDQPVGRQNLQSMLRQRKRPL